MLKQKNNSCSHKRFSLKIFEDLGKYPNTVRGIYAMYVPVCECRQVYLK
jgi:hypothetical protein